MNPRRFVNLILEDSRRRMYSLHRLDAMKHLFYPSAEALRAAHDAKTTTKKKPSTLEHLPVLPEPEINFHPMASSTLSSMNMNSFSLIGRDGGIVFTDSFGSTVLYSTVNGTFAVIPPTAGSLRGPYCMNLPMTQASHPADRTGEHQGSTLYVMDLSSDVGIHDRFLVLVCHQDEGWRWCALPGPPFVSARTTCYTVVDSSTIYISSMQMQGDPGTYAFDTARHGWRQVGKWALPWCGKAEYVPELKFWLGLSLPAGSAPVGNLLPVCSPHFPRLCALDLSAMDGADQPPTPQGAWDYLDMPEDNKRRMIAELHLVNLGSGMFCIATVLKDLVRLPRVYDPWTDDEDGSPCTPHEDDMMDVLGDEIVILTGVKVERCCDGDDVHLQMIKHKSRCYDLKEHTMKSVL